MTYHPPIIVRKADQDLVPGIGTSHKPGKEDMKPDHALVQSQ